MLSCVSLSENGGPIKVRSYTSEKSSGNKLDYFGEESSTVSLEPLLATVVLYVSNTTQGGELLFPNSEVSNNLTYKRSTFFGRHNKSVCCIHFFVSIVSLQVKFKKSWSECSDTGNILRPVKGNAVLFFTRLLNASLDRTSTHFRCPVLKGELLVATKLIYAKKQARNYESGECSDEDDNCGRWAELGECKKNPVYMIGSPDYFGTCRKSCNAC